MNWTAGHDLYWCAGGFCGVVAFAGVIYMLVATFVVWRFRRAPPQRLRAAQPVSILVPLCGAEDGLYERLCVLCEQRYEAPVQLVCGVQDEHDPAIDVVKRVASAHQGQVIDLAVDSRQHGRNRKISNLVNMARLARYDIFVVIDSDIEVGRDYLACVVGELQKPGVGAVTCLYHGVSGRDFWSALSAMAIDTYFVPNVVTGLRFALARPCFGATIALTRSMLENIGGFRGFADCLFDDYAIGESIRAFGREVVVPPLALGHVCQECSVRDMLKNQLRYARTIKAIDPLGNAGAIITHPLAMALLALTLGCPESVELVLLALGSRLLLCMTLEHTFALGRHRYWLLPIRDLMSFAIYLAAFFGNRISWRGERFRLSSDGNLIPDPN